MAIGRTFEESLLKAIDSLDIKFNYQLGLELFDNRPPMNCLKYRNPRDERFSPFSRRSRRDSG